MRRADRTEAWHVDHIPRALNRIGAEPARVDKADGSYSGRVMAALSLPPSSVLPQPTSLV
jgi:hypothetical protein